MSDESRIDLLKNVGLFAAFKNNVPKLKAIASHLGEKTFNQGETIIKEGTTGDVMFILTRGEVRILKKTLGEETYTIILLKAGEGNYPFFGELALVDQDDRSATILAERECHCYTLNRRDFIALGDEDREIGLSVTRGLSKILSERLRKMNNDFLLLFRALVEEVDN